MLSSDLLIYLPEFEAKAVSRAFDDTMGHCRRAPVGAEAVNRTMPEAEASLYLPISEPTLRDVLDEARTLNNVLRDLSPHETASLLLLEGLSKRRDDRSPPSERTLADIVRSCRLLALEAGPATLLEHVLSVLSRAGIDAGRRRLPELRIALLDQASVERGEFLSADGRWDHGFAERHRESLAAALVRAETETGEPTRLTREQSRIFLELRAEDDEPLHVQGYAGTGKSSLIGALIEMLEPSGARVLVLAETRRQLRTAPVDDRRARHVDKNTFDVLADRLMGEDLTSPAYLNLHRRKRSRGELPDEELARLLGIHAEVRFTAAEIARAVRATLFVFCRSDDDELGERHLPRAWRQAFDLTLGAATCQHARALWEAIVSRPAKELEPLIGDHHAIKWVALNRWPIPDPYTHVIVDESHYLPGAVRQILSSSPQAVWTLGDDYQNLGGHTPPARSGVRAREMTHSIRSGEEVEELINPIIAAHPGGTKAPFHGNRMHRVEIVRYDARRARVPQRAAAILVDDTWGLFEWVQRIVSAGANVELMGDHRDLDRFVKDCIELHTRGIRARHRALLRFDSWEQVATHHHGNPGFQRVDRLLARGYGYRDWLRTYARLSRRDTGPTHSVGLIGDTLNHEFDTVMLAPSVLGDERSRRRAAFGSSIYVTLTRARRRLIVPDGLRHWIEALSAPRGSALLDDRPPASRGD